MKKFGIAIDKREMVEYRTVTRDRNGDYRNDGPMAAKPNPNLDLNIAEVFESEAGEMIPCGICNGVFDLKVAEGGEKLYKPLGGWNSYGGSMFPIELGAFVTSPNSVDGATQSFREALESGGIQIELLPESERVQVEAPRYRTSQPL